MSKALEPQAGMLSCIVQLLSHIPNTVGSRRSITGEIQYLWDGGTTSEFFKMLPREIWHTMVFENRYLITNSKEKHTFPLAMLLTIWEFRGKTRKLWRYLCTCTHMLMFIDAWHIHKCKTHIYNLITETLLLFLKKLLAWVPMAVPLSGLLPIRVTTGEGCIAPVVCSPVPGSLLGLGLMAKAVPLLFHQFPLPDLHILFGCIIVF